MKIEEAKRPYLKIDEIIFKYYLGAQLDKFFDDKGNEGKAVITKKDLNELYFDILERFDFYIEGKPTE